MCDPVEVDARVKLLRRIVAANGGRDAVIARGDLVIARRRARNRVDR